MRLGWSISLLAHGLAAVATFYAMPQFGRDEELTPGVVITPIEIVDISDAPSAPALATPDATVESAEASDVEQLEETVAPAPDPTPQQRPEQRRLTQAEIRARLMADAQAKGPERDPNAREGDRNRPRVGDGSRESQTLESRVASLMDRHMARCWRSTVDAADPDQLVVTLRINLDREGRLVGRPELVRPSSVRGNPRLRVAVDNAIRAAYQCSPYPFPDDPTVGEHYEFWRSNNVRFGANVQQ